jgi:hypothetical protein
MPLVGGASAGLANETQARLGEVVKKFGRPTTPIRIRPKKTEGEQK